MRIGVRELKLFIRLTRPHFLLGGFLLYGLGASIAGYLGIAVGFGRYLIGQILVTTIQLMAHYLNEYFDAEIDRSNSLRTLFSGGSGALGPDGLPKNVALYAAVLALALAATTASAALVSGALPKLAWVVLLAGFAGAYFYNAPPLRLVSSGYGEVIASLVVAGLVPTFGFVIHAEEIHRLLLMSTMPLMALSFAMLIVFELPDYAADLKHDKRTLLVRMGWSTGMWAHDLAILLALVSLGIALYSGLPHRVGWGALIVLPLGIAQLWQMRRIRQGFPPRWNSLTLSALALFALTAYLELAGYLLS